MAKKITDNTPIQNFEDPWGGTYQSGANAGKEWGKTRSEVERVIKEKVGEIEVDINDLKKDFSDAIDDIRIDSWETVNMGTRINGLTSGTGSTGTYTSANSNFRVLKKQFNEGDILEISRSVAPSSSKYIFVLAGTVEPAAGVAYTQRLAYSQEDTPVMKVVMPFNGWIGIRFYLTDNTQTPVVKKAVMYKDKVAEEIENITDEVENINEQMDEIVSNALASYDSEDIGSWDQSYWIDGNNHYNSSSAKGRFLDVTAYRGKTMRLKARTSRTAVYAFLASKNNYTSNSTPDFVEGTQRVTVAGGTTVEVTVPDNATLLYVEYNKGATSTESNLTYPASVAFIGTIKDKIESFADVVESIRAQMDEVVRNALASYDSEDIGSWDQSYWIDGNNHYNSSSAKGRFLDVTAYRGKTMRLKARTSRTAVYAFLASKNNYTSNSTPDFVEGTQRVTVAGGTTVEVTVPDNATLLYVEYNKGATSTESNLTYPASVAFMGTINDKVEIFASEVNKSAVAAIHVNAESGNNSNDGLTPATAVATVAQALLLSGQDAHIILHGDTTEYVTFVSRKRVTMTNAPGEKARIVRGSKISEATYDSATGIYSKDISDVADTTFGKATAAANYWIYQHDVPDASTLIPVSERHPAQRGATYRCGSARLTRYTSLAALQAVESMPAYYYDSANTMLYFRIADGTTLATNPIVLPIYNNRGLRAYETEVHLTGIDVLYGYVALSRCTGSTITDCSAMYAFGGENDSCGCFVLWSSRDVTFTRCEAARATLGTSSATGDGFNIHLGSTENFTDRRVKYMTATLIDCWGHDNSDEGSSDHGRSEVTYIGGLYEHNGTGCAPAVGSCSTFYNVTFRANDTEGLRNGATISLTADQVGVGTCTFAYNCLSENNGGRGFETSNGKAGRPNAMTLVGCKAVNNTGVGFYSSDTGKNPMYLYDCSYSGSGTAVSNAAAIISTTPLGT